jgi:hypothetical protein
MVRGVLAGYSRRSEPADSIRLARSRVRPREGTDAIVGTTLSQVCPDEDVRQTGANSRPSQSFSFVFAWPKSYEDSLHSETRT